MAYKPLIIKSDFSAYCKLGKNITDTEIGYLNGVTSSIQTQLDRLPFWIAGHNNFSPIDSTTYGIGVFQGVALQGTLIGAGSMWQFPFAWLPQPPCYANAR